MAAKKMALTAALLLVLVALARATTYTTTVTTTTVDDEANPGQQQQCQRQLQGRQFRSCQTYLTYSRGGSQYGRGEEEEMGGDEVGVLEMSTDITNPSQQHREHLRQCCSQLQSVQEQCRCQAIKQVAKQAQQMQGQQGQQGQQTGQSEKVYARARDLPKRCNFRTQQCQFQVIFV